MSDDERWLPVVGYEGLYEVSDCGRIYSSQARRILKPRPGSTGRTGSNRYPRVALCVDGKATVRPVHRIVLEAFVGPCPKGMHGLHFDDDPTNNHLSNLRWGTRADNSMDAVRNGMNSNGSKTHCKRDHEFTTDNTYIQPSGRRECRACRRQRHRGEFAAENDATRRMATAVV